MLKHIKTCCGRCGSEITRETVDHGYCKTADYKCPTCSRKVSHIIEIHGRTGKAGEKLTAESVELLKTISIS